MKKIRVFLKERSYDILIGDGLIDDCGNLLKRLDIGRDAVCISNKNLLSLYRARLEKSLKKSGLTVHFELVPDSEKAKSITVATRLINRISSYDKHKDVFIIAFGGGVIGDVAGFVAAAYKRGIPYAQIPTTLLAQVDSAIGGKVAVDLDVAKNLVGAFYQPKIVISDISLIRSLPARQIRNGLAEIVKYGIIKDKELFKFLEANYKKILGLHKNALEYVVLRSAEIKAAVVAKDEFDKKSVRAILNYGHTFGHAVEAASGYSAMYNHGEAVAIGMVIAARIALNLGLIKLDEVLRIEGLIKKIGLPSNIKKLRISDIYEAHLRDKKFVHGKNRLILPTGIGSVKVVEGVPDPVIKSVLKTHIL